MTCGFPKWKSMRSPFTRSLISKGAPQRSWKSSACLHQNPTPENERFSVFTFQNPKKSPKSIPTTCNAWTNSVAPPVGVRKVGIHFLFQSRHQAKPRFVSLGRWVLFFCDFDGMEVLSSQKQCILSRCVEISKRKTKKYYYSLL